MASSSLSRTWRYRVFTSFHGPDVRKTFLSHLRRQFNSNGITMFDDQGIERGQTIAPSLTEAIRESRISIVMLSKNYASSSWCLDELLEILKCKEAIGQIVMTVFYGVDPTDVRKQTGEFGTAFNKTCACKTEEAMERWSLALEAVGNIAGEHFLIWDNEAKMIEKIARDVSDKLNATPSRDFDDMVGLEAHLREMESLLDLDYDGVKIVAIYGPAGTGKTTIARALQSLISNRFQLKCFVENLRGSYHSGVDEYDLKLRLQENLLSSILDQDGMRICHLGSINERLCDLKVLIILDDVNDVKQLEALVDRETWFGPGSRIIVTTENKELLQQHGINNMYHVGFPSNEEALQILCRYAFRKISPWRGFEKLARKVIELCGNLPLGLRVVGSCLHGKNAREWDHTIRRLETSIGRDIEDILRVGYESLDENEQTLFLHIAVFFNHKDGDLLKVMLADNDLDIEYGLKILVNRSLIDISTKGEVVMHKLLQQMGRQAIHRQEPWKRKILIDSDEICDVLENETGTGNVSGLSFNTSGINEVIISSRSLRRMRNLRFLSVYKTRNDGNDRVHIPEEMDFPPRLRLLHWEAYPSKSIPLRFCAQNLVELNMEHSQVEKLWEGTQPLTNLKKMNLTWSVHLKELPDFSSSTNLVRLELGACKALEELPSSFGKLHKLKELWMNYCDNLQVIPTGINLASLERVDMMGCSRLTTFPDFSTNIKTLYLSDTRIERLPSSVKHWSRLTDVLIRDTGILKALTHLPRSVEWLNLDDTDIEQIPDCFNGLDLLRGLYLSRCKKLTSLPKLPPSLEFLLAEDCASLESVTCPLNTPNATFNFSNCFKLGEAARREIIKRSLFACLPGRVMPSEFNHRARGNSVTVPLSSASYAFKACVMISPLQLQHTGEGRFTSIQCLIGGFSDVLYLGHPEVRTEHLCIFLVDMPQVSNEAKFEFQCSFYSEFESYEGSYEIIECGVRIMTCEEDMNSEDYDDSSYNFEVLEDSVISCDSESENEHITGCWSWLFVCFDLSNILKNIGSLCWGQENR